MQRLFSLLPLASFLLLVAIISTSVIFTPALAQSDTAAEHIDEVYKLGTGDRLRVTVFGEEDLSGEFDIDGTGSVALPLIGNQKAAGIDVRALEIKVEKLLSEGYLVSPRVSIEVMNFRPFFILGEVNEPGSYPYVNGLTVINAVALAGGFTHRARTDRVIITRGKGDKKEELEAEEDTPVFPGDSLRVTERFF